MAEQQKRSSEMTQLTTELCTTQQHDDAIHEAIAKHAFALYESEGFKDGNDQDHWFRAERELTYPDASVVFENEASFQTIRVPLEGGFSLLVSISPRNVLMFAAGNGGGAVEREVLRIIPIPAEVAPEQVKASLQGEELTLAWPTSIANPTLDQSA